MKYSNEESELSWTARNISGDFEKHEAILPTLPDFVNIDDVMNLAAIFVNDSADFLELHMANSLKRKTTISYEDDNR